MKRILIALLVILTTTFLANAQNGGTYNKQDTVAKAKTTVTTNQNKNKINNSSVTVESEDITVSDSANVDTTNVSNNHSNNNLLGIDDDDFPFDLNHTIENGIILAIITIIAVFGLPIFILFFVFYFRYKNRKARYHLAEQALAAGQPLPDNFIKDVKTSNPRTQGIRNTFTGIGLFIFLWAITGEFGLGAIGLLVMFMGIGQWITGIKKENRQNSDEPNQ